MRWTLLDGSPRGRRSNTAILLRRLGAGLSGAGHEVELHHLAVRRDRAGAERLFADAEGFVLGFPLYADAMPALVKELIEALEPLQGRSGNPPIAFLVQSGFPEPGQSRAIERYLEKLARRLGSPYLGTIVKGGVEGIQSMPAWMTRGLLHRIEAIGRGLGTTGRLDPQALRALAGPEWYSGWRQIPLRIALATMTKGYWNGMLKRNRAYALRFDQPYV